jgi:hypothetical protein
MFKRAIITSAVILFILTGAIHLSAAEFLPLAPGNTWTYRDAASGHSFTVQVGTQVFLNQRIYHTLRGYVAEQLLVRVNEYGNIVYWDDDRGSDILLTSFEVVPRSWWEAPGRECEQQGQTQEASGTHDGPAGKWSVLQIQYRTLGCADAGTQSEQYAENIGMVRRVMNTIAGPRTFNLVHARMGTLTISPGSAGSFSVTAAPESWPGFWLVTLRIEVPAETMLTLHFPSAQEYDLRVRDVRGNILWTWSADKLFAQMVHERRISGGFSASVVVPHPPAIPEGPHFYTIEAWLTNVESDPQFAAVTGVRTN